MHDTQTHGDGIRLLRRRVLDLKIEGGPLTLCGRIGGKDLERDTGIAPLEGWNELWQPVAADPIADDKLAVRVDFLSGRFAPLEGALQCEFGGARLAQNTRAFKRQLPAARRPIEEFGANNPLQPGNPPRNCGLSNAQFRSRSRKTTDPRHGRKY